MILTQSWIELELKRFCSDPKKRKYAKNITFKVNSIGQSNEKQNQTRKYYSYYASIMLQVNFIEALWLLHTVMYFLLSRKNFRDYDQFIFKKLFFFTKLTTFLQDLILHTYYYGKVVNLWVIYNWWSINDFIKI